MFTYQTVFLLVIHHINHVQEVDVLLILLKLDLWLHCSHKTLLLILENRLAWWMLEEVDIAGLKRVRSLEELDMAM